MEDKRKELLEKINSQEDEAPVEEPVKEEGTDIPQPMNSNDLKELQEMVKTATESFNTMDAVTRSTLETLDADMKSIEIIEALLKTNTTEAEGRDLYTYDHKFGESDIHYEVYVSIYDIEQTIHLVGGESDEDTKKRFQEVFEVACQYLTIRDSMIGIQEEYRSQMKEQYNYYTSPEYAKLMDEKLKSMKERYESEEDPVVKEKLGKAIGAIESMNTMDYIFKRLTENADEYKTIAEIFFDGERSKYMMKRWNAKAFKLGVNPGIFHEFLSIETRFLPEKYHPFNNLFLFAMMRNIAHIDVNNKDDVMYAKNTLRMLTRLMNHAFPTQEVENSFIKVIESYLERFMSLRDDFATNNLSYAAYIASLKDEKLKQEKGDAETQEDLHLNEHYEFDDSIWLATCVTEDAMYVISELKSEDGGIKLFANGRSIIKPSEVEPEHRTTLALLPAEYEDESISHILTSMPVADVVTAIDASKNAFGVRVVPHINSYMPYTNPVDGSDEHVGYDHILGHISPDELINCSTRNDIDWAAQVDGSGEVPILNRMGYDKYFLGHYVIINYIPGSDYTENQPYVWLADDKGIIRTNVPMKKLMNAISSGNTNETTKEETNNG